MCIIRIDPNFSSDSYCNKTYLKIHFFITDLRHPCCHINFHVQLHLFEDFSLLCTNIIVSWCTPYYMIIQKILTFWKNQPFSLFFSCHLVIVTFVFFTSGSGYLLFVICELLLLVKVFPVEISISIFRLIWGSLENKWKYWSQSQSSFSLYILLW